MTKPIDLLKLHLARAGKERSRAIESKYYGYGSDPARHVKFESELTKAVKPGKDAK